MQLQILGISISIRFSEGTGLPIHNCLVPYYGSTQSDRDTSSLCIEVEKNPFRKVCRGDVAKWRASIEAQILDGGILFTFPSGQFFTDPDFTNVQVWSPYEREISIERDGYENYNGDPALRLILWGRAASVEKISYMHGALVFLDGKYFLLMGDSGVGKTTLSSLVCQIGGTCLTEEDPFVGWHQGRPMAHGSPWPGMKGKKVPLSGELSAIFFLSHSHTNRCRKLDIVKASRKLLHNTRTFNWLPQTIPDAIDLIDQVAHSVPAYDFGFVPDTSAVEEIGKVLW